MKYLLGFGFLFVLLVSPVAHAEWGCFNCEEEFSYTNGPMNRARCVQVAPETWGRANYCEVRTRQYFLGPEMEYCFFAGNSCFYIEVSSPAQVADPVRKSAELREMPLEPQRVARYY